MAGREPAGLTEGSEKDLQILVMGGERVVGSLCSVQTQGWFPWDSRHASSQQESSSGCVWWVWSPELQGWDWCHLLVSWALHANRPCCPQGGLLTHSARMAWVW